MLVLFFTPFVFALIILTGCINTSIVSDFCCGRSLHPFNHFQRATAVYWLVSTM